MNLIDAEVIEVLSKPVSKYGKWFVKVRYDTWGNQGVTEIMTDTYDESLNITFKYYMPSLKRLEDLALYHY